MQTVAFSARSDLPEALMASAERLAAVVNDKAFDDWETATERLQMVSASADCTGRSGCRRAGWDSFREREVVRHPTLA
jgi:hypothetical protein